MKCYKCGGTLTHSDKCPQCGADVTIYRKAVEMSNSYYNVALAKAKTRDLSGAVESLKISIMLNKKNISARNLLGLVYCEMGDVIEALGQWVVSKNMEKENNPAGSYIEQIQNNQSKFDVITANIKKYNLSLKYANEGNYDMAVLQLKKITAQTPEFLKAQLLLALLYIKNKEYQRAKKCLQNVLKVDMNNTVANLYLKEIGEETARKKNDNQGSFLPEKRERKVLERKPLSGNDVILPRSSYKEPSNGAITIINVLVGVVIGAALIWFLVMPSKYKGITEEYNASISDYSEQLSSGNVELNSLESQLEQVKKEKDALEAKMSSANGGSNKLLTALISAANSYITNDTIPAAEALMDVDVTALPTDDAKKLYNTIAEATLQQAAQDFYDKGTKAYERSDFENAARYFVNTFKCDSTKEDAAYYAAKSYVALEQQDNAVKYYKYIVEGFPNSKNYKEAKDYVDSHNT